MSKRVLIFLAVLISMVLLVSSTAIVISDASFETKEEKIEDMDEVTPSESESVDVPTWQVGHSWTYYHELEVDDDDGDFYLYMEEEFTYTVEAIEYYEVNESTYLSYNLTLEGEVIDGDAEVEGYSIEIDEGIIEGYKICRVSDLGIVEDRQYREIDATAEYVIGVDVWLDLNQRYQPPLENYDFPIAEDDLFWANTTMRSWGYYEYDAGSIGEGYDTFDDNITYESEAIIPYKEMVSTPAGDFEAYYVNHTVKDGDAEEGEEEYGHMESWYESGVKSYVKEIQQIRMDDDELIMEQRLQDHNVSEITNELSIDPSEQWVEDEVTLTGQFPDHPNEDVTIRLPEGAEPMSEWTTTTDGDGSFEEVIEVPLADDMTETSHDFSSVGFVAELDDYENEHAVATLVIHHDNAPIHPTPVDGAEDVDPNPEMSVLIGHDKDESMNVTFYDASDDSEIGFAENISSIDYASTTWDGLEIGTTYEWYAVADDEVNTYESEIWSFTTQVDEAEYFSVEITSPEQGEGFIGGEPVNVDYTVENTGGEAGVQDVEFYVDGTLVETEPEVSLGPGESYEGEFIWDTTGEEPGSYDLLVSSEDDDDLVMVTILEEGIFNVEIVEYPEEVNEGEDVLLEYSVINTGDESTQTIEFTVDGALEDSAEITLGASEEHQGEFTWTAGAPGDYTLAVASEDDVDEVVVTVIEEVVEYELTIEAEEGGTTDPEPDTYTHEQDTEVPVEAIPDEEWEFSHWEGDVPEGEQEEAEITIYLDDNKEITAHFEEDDPVVEYELTIESTEGGEVVEPGEGTFEYEEDETVGLEAVAEDGYQFVEWTGDVETIDDTEEAETTIVMEDDYTITAEFEEIEEEVYYTLNIEVDGFGYVSTNPGEDYYEEGTEVELTANPQSGWVFNEWSGDVPEGEEDNEEITITMDEDKEITAHFLREPFFEVGIVRYDEEVTEGEVVEVEYTVTNIGDFEGTQIIEFTVDDVLEDSEEVTLEPDEEHEGLFSWQSEEHGEFEIEISSYDDQDLVSTERVDVSVVEEVIEEEPEDEGWPFLWLILIVIVIVAVILVVVLASRGKGDEEDEMMDDRYVEGPPEPTPPPETNTGQEGSPEEISPPPQEEVPEPNNGYEGEYD